MQINNSATKTEIESERFAKIALWVSKAQTGDENAFALLYKTFANRLYLFCRRLTGEVSAAEEVVQEAFIKAWLALPQFRNQGGFYPWLRQIASRIAIDRLRQKNAKIWENRVDFDEAVTPALPGVERNFDLEKLISHLPDGARTVFVMYEIEGYLHREIAKLIGIAEGTSKTQLARARELLKAGLIQETTNAEERR